MVRRLPQRPALFRFRQHQCLSFGFFFLAEEKLHQQSDNHAKTDRTHNRAMPSSGPKILAVKMIANILIAGPLYKNATAGPRPAPRL